MNKKGKELIKKNIHECARDLIALGSIPFFILVLVRVYLLNKPDYFSQFLVAGVLFLVLAFSFKFDRYSGMGLIVLVFTILYYNARNYTIFSSAIYILLLMSLVYLKKGKRKVFFGTAIGALCSVVSYYVINLL